MNEQLIEDRLTDEQLSRAKNKVLSLLFHTGEHETNVVHFGREGIGQISMLLDEVQLLKSELQQTREELSAKDKVLELITDLWGIQEIHNCARSILSQHKGEDAQ